MTDGRRASSAPAGRSSTVPRDAARTRDELAAQAQRAAEQRLELAERVLFGELEDEEHDKLAQQLAGPYDGCTTCVAREVLDAAAPFLEQLGRQ